MEMGNVSMVAVYLSEGSFLICLNSLILASVTAGSSEHCKFLLDSLLPVILTFVQNLLSDTL